MQITPLLSTGWSVKGKGVQLPKPNKSRQFKTYKRQIRNIKNQEDLIVEPKSLSKFDGLQKSDKGYNFKQSKRQIDITKRLSQERDRLTQKYRLDIKKRIQTNIQNKVKKINSSNKVKKCACGDCEQCLKDFSYFLNLFSNDQSVPVISSKSWCIWRKGIVCFNAGKNNKYMYYYGKRIHKVRQIASLSKIITSMTTIDFLNKYEYNPDKVHYIIRKSSTMIGGTSANLQIQEVYTISQLLYGLMLPSGNDAALALSQVIGLLQNIKNRHKQVNPHAEGWYKNYVSNNKSYSYLFINLMNEKCQKLGLLDTHFYNSHGNDAYDQLKNVSTCNEIAKVSSQFMKYEFLKRIANCKRYEVELYEKVWENTNKLLEDGFDGIKTGITDTAGPCLAASYKDLIIVVLNSKSMNQRWIQVKKLVRWIFRKGL